jgi:Secretion system C-terminal sorting domain/Outer membrane protein Omp28
LVLLNSNIDMKRFTMMLAAAATLTLGVQTNAAAQATRNAVILEIATGTWCQYCPGAALGADDMHASTASTGIVEHHDSDPYSTPDAVARYDTYYGVTGFPTAFFDGGNSVVGGSHTQSMYTSYLQKYTTAMAVATPFDLTASWVQNGASIDVTVDVTQVGANTSSAIRVQAALTESHIQVNWQGLSECNFVNRAMHPSAAGTPISTTNGGPAAHLTFNMPINPAWVQNEMELVVWVEDGSTKQIYNGRYMPLAVAAFANDPSAVEITNEIGTAACISSIAPEVKIRNMGSNALTSVDFSYSVNGGAAQTANWTGSLNFLGYATATLPAIAFTPAANNTLTVNITNVSDGNMTNNMVTKAWAAAPIHSPGTYVMLIQPDNYGSETSWDIKSSAGATIASGGPYTDGNTTPVSVNVAINPSDCYVLTVYDAYGDGMCCSFGNGGYSLTNPTGGVVASGGQFSSSEMKSWESNTTTAVSNALTEAISVYPNPTRGIFNIAIPSGDAAEIAIMNVAGKLVYSSNSDASLVKVDLSSLAAGLYMVRVKTAEGIAVKKITKE